MSDMAGVTGPGLYLDTDSGYPDWNVVVHHDRQLAVMVVPQPDGGQALVAFELNRAVGVGVLLIQAPVSGMAIRDQHDDSTDITLSRIAEVLDGNDHE